MPDNNRTRLLVARRVPAAVAARAESEFNAYVTDADMDASSVVEFCNRYETPAVLIGKKSGLQAECHGAALWSQCGVGIRAPLEGRHIGA
ncbi:hypothetical protein K6L09_42995, partial [Burkholderia cepacia]